ncbi:hypothetical protein [Pantoea agglomerans]|uniref:hypothetical protein n=1 Tax=Enterobacter agglomerans TaxID=549 RepID=UPI00301AA736
MEDVNRLPRSEILGEMQNIIIQGAALSRYFWPVRESHASRGQYLRDALEIGEDSPLKNRDLRNAIEHFDERLDRYLSQGQFGIFVLDYVGPRLVDNGIAGHTFRAFYMGEEKFKLLDKEYELTPLLDEITRVGKSLFKIESNVRCN